VENAADYASPNGPEMDSAPRPRPPRLWPLGIILAMQFVFLVLTVTPEINNFVRFAFMMLGPLVCVAMFTIWLLAASRVRWYERLLIVAIVAATGFAVSPLTHETARLALWLYGVPLAMLLVAVGLRAGCNWRPPVRLALVLGMVATGWSVFLLPRLDGFDGAYWPEFRWRWRATPEELLVIYGKDDPAKDASAVSELAEPLTLRPGDWPGFRGPDRDNRVALTDLQTDWGTSPPRELWRMRLGPAWSAFTAVDGRLFTQEQRGEDEQVVCFEAATGQEVWRHADTTRFTDIVAGPGPRATPTFADGRLYTLGGRALLTCLDAARGDVVWQRDLMAELDAELPVWGFSGSPLVTHGVAIVYAGGRDDHGLVAYDSQTGEPAWHVAGSGMNFSSAQLAMIEDVPQILFTNESGLMGIEPATGEVLWKITPSGWKSAPMVQPQPIGSGSVVVALGDGIGVARIEVSRVGETWQATEAWSSRGLKPAFNDFVYYDGHLYGFDQSIFACVDADSGERRWKQGRYGFGQVLLMQDAAALLVLTETGRVVLLAADPAEHRELARLDAIEGKTWNHPIVAGNQLLVRNSEEAACYELPTRNSTRGSTRGASGG